MLSLSLLKTHIFTYHGLLAIILILKNVFNTLFILIIKLLGIPHPCLKFCTQSLYLPHLITGTLPVTRKSYLISLSQVLQRGRLQLRKQKQQANTSVLLLSPFCDSGLLCRCMYPQMEGLSSPAQGEESEMGIFVAELHTLEKLLCTYIFSIAR